MKVLIVDDEPGMLTLLTLLLERLDHEVTPAPNAAAALEKLTTITTPELIITDLMMPHMSGQTFITEVRRILPDIPLLVVTAVTDTATLRKVIEEGADHVMSKPVTRPTLDHAIRTTMDAAQAKSKN